VYVLSTDFLYFCSVLASHINLLGFSQGMICRKSNPRPAQLPSLLGGFSGLKLRNSVARPPNQLIESSAPLVREVKSGEELKSRPKS